MRSVIIQSFRLCSLTQRIYWLRYNRRTLAALISGAQSAQAAAVQPLQYLCQFSAVLGLGIIYMSCSLSACM